MPTERVILANSDDEDDLYKGYNEFNPILDTRNLQDDEAFKETVNKSSYGRLGTKQRLNTSTAGVAFNRSTALKSRKAGNTTAAGRSSHGLLNGNATSNRPLTAVRGAGYTSTSQSAVFDPLKLASQSGIAGSKLTTDFRLQDENAAEFKIRQLEAQIGKTLEESVVQAEGCHYSQALELAKDCVTKERSLTRLKEQNGLLEQFGTNSDLTLAVLANLAEQYTNMQMWPEAINVLQSILKNRSFTNTGRFRLNIGVIHFWQGEYPKAIKFFRMALDQVPQSSAHLRLMIMQNIGLAFVKLQQFADAIASFEYIASEKGELDSQTAFHLIVCYYALGDVLKMRHFFDKLLHVRCENEFEDRYGHHEVLNNGGTLFASTSGVAVLSPAEVSSSFDSGLRPSSPILLIRDQHDHHQNLMLDVIRNDRLRQLEKTRIQNAEWCVLTAAKLIAPFITMTGGPEELSDSSNSSSITSGLDWCIEQLRKVENDSFYLPVSNDSSTGLNSTSSSTGSGLNMSNLADELELYKSVQHLRAREFDAAITTLKIFEKKDKLLGSGTVSSARLTASGSVDNPSARPISSAMAAIGTSQNSSTSSLGFVSSGKIVPTGSGGNSTGNARVAATAATNLSFLYLLQNDIPTAGRYADEAIQVDRYSFGALLNRGNVYFAQGDFHRASEFYREVIQTSASSMEAQYNLALAEKKLGNYEAALEGLFRLRQLAKAPLNGTGNGRAGGRNSQFRQRISNTIEVQLLYQIGTIYELMNNLDQAIDFYQQVLNIIPSDVSLLVKLADIASENNDRKQALSHLMDANRFMPSHIPTLERLAAYYIEVKMYEKSIKFMEQLSNIQPDEIKWQMMIAASHRRAGNYQQSFNMYQSIHGRFPDNSDCLKFLIRICTEFAEDNQSGISGSRNYAKLAEDYTETLKRIEKNRELREQQQAQQQQSNSRSTSRASGRISGASNPMGQPSSGGQQNGSRDGSATTASSGSSSGYMSKNKPLKSPITGNIYMNGSGNILSSSSPMSNDVQISSSSSSTMNRAAISAIVDQVVEQLDNGALNERPTTSWSHRKDRLMSAVPRDHNYDDDDLLLDANLDDILPD